MLRQIMLSTWVLSTAVLAQPQLSPIPSDVPTVANYDVEVLADDFNQPWGLSFLPNGAMLVAERSGSVQLLSSDGASRVVLEGTPEAFVNSQAGFFEALPHPDFANNQWIYLSYAWGTNEENGLRVARAKLSGNNLIELEVLFTVSPLKSGGAHYGGRMTFLPDGSLVFGTGEGYNYREHSQRLDSLMGKVIRLNDDGTVPSDNPFVGREDARAEIWSYGHRNPQGIVFDTEANVLYVHEHGPKGGDEINVIEPALNYGWPAITYGTEYSGAQITPYTELDGMIQPMFYYDPSIAPAGFALLQNSQFSAWDGDFLIAALAGKELRHVDMENGQVVGQHRLLTEREERFRDVRQGPDGAIYVLTDSSEGSLLRLTPAQ
ncbi:PQQ-dependent sugar dehydrogenase [uncultured Umboniibacter sp.]|uniref:PQQ-dependent sugar dehydrogenase n=1 Tax=uncultured Umboniibacter sp. TaxID=1798917 RepID=UPI00261C9FBC|nr:PQQ-dependent sugar dehydrogenase [uncultured Umboniibacter sp.]